MNYEVKWVAHKDGNILAKYLEDALRGVPRDKIVSITQSPQDGYSSIKLFVVIDRSDQPAKAAAAATPKRAKPARQPAGAAGDKSWDFGR